MNRVESIELRPGYQISRILKGGWQLAGGHAPVDRTQAIKEMRDYLEAGITTFDCADIYTGVEQMIGDFRRAVIAGGRSELLQPLKVHTKCVPDLGSLKTISKADVQKTIDRSLRRLGLDQLDLVQFHWWDLSVPRYIEVASWLADFQKQGKIDLIGATNFNSNCTAELVEAGIPIASMQVQYSLLDERPQKSLVDICKRSDIHLLCYGTVAGGFLSDRWLGTREPVGQLENRSLVKYKLIVDDSGGWEWFQSLLQALRTVADRHCANIGQVAMRAVLDRAQVAGIIVGVRHGGHLESHRRLFELHLDERDQEVIAAILAQRKSIEGDVYDAERNIEGRHGRIMHYDLNQA